MKPRPHILVPLNGIDRCYCGAKYWTADARCASCGEPHEPDLPFPDHEEEPDYDGYDAAMLALMDEEAEARRWEAAHYLRKERDR